MKSKRILFSKQSDEWNTPPDLFRRLDNVFNFKLDPCTTKDNPLMVYEHYDKKEDGLSKDWYNVSTFVNPPYSQIKKWIDKVLIELQKRVDRQLSRGYGVHTVAPIVMLVPARTDTRWFWGTTYSNWVSVVFIKGRLKFSGSKNSAPFPSCLIVLSYDRGAPQLAQLGVDVLPCYKLKPLDD